MDVADQAKVRNGVASPCLAGSPDATLHAASSLGEGWRSSQLGRRVAACEAYEAVREVAWASTLAAASVRLHILLMAAAPSCVRPFAAHGIGDLVDSLVALDPLNRLSAYEVDYSLGDTYSGLASGRASSSAGRLALMAVCGALTGSSRSRAWADLGTAVPALAASVH